MNHPALALLLLLIFPTARADTWTSTDGRTLEGDFVNYDESRGLVTIRRQDDNKSIDIPEELLAHVDILKAIELENKRVQPYWYAEYSVAQAEKPSSRCLLLVPNGEATEAFELICYKLLLKERFQKLLESRDFVVCIQTEIPEEIAYLRTRRNGEDWKDERLDVSYPDKPLALIVDFRRARSDIVLSKLRLQNWQPYYGPSWYDEVEKDIRRYKKRESRD